MLLENDGYTEIPSCPLAVPGRDLSFCTEEAPESRDVVLLLAADEPPDFPVVDTQI